MAFDIFGAGSGTTTTKPTPAFVTAEPTIANVRQVDQQLQNAPVTIEGWQPVITRPSSPVYQIMPITYGGGYKTYTTEAVPTANQYEATEPTASRYPTATPTIGYGVGYDVSRLPGLNLGRVPNLPEGYGYAYGFPFRGTQPKGLNVESPTVPDWANNSTGFNWADASAYGSGIDKTGGSPVKFNEQGKLGKAADVKFSGNQPKPGVLPSPFTQMKGQQSTYEPTTVYNQDVFDKYRAGSQTWNPIYRDWFGSGMYNTEMRTQQDFNWLANQYGIGIHDAGVPRYAGTDTGGAEQAAWLQNALITDWMRKYGKGMNDADVQKMVTYLTQRPPSSGSSSPVQYASATKPRYYYGGGGGGYSYNSGGGYSPSWFNGLLSWRI